MARARYFSEIRCDCAELVQLNALDGRSAATPACAPQGELLLLNAYSTSFEQTSLHFLTVSPVRKDPGVEFVDLARDVLEPSAVMILEAAVWRRLRAVGVTRVGQSLIVAMADPMDRLAIMELEVRTGLRVVATQADERLILEALDRSYDPG